MQAWNSQAECIFCLFRSTLRRTSRISTPRAYHATSVLHKSQRIKKQKEDAYPIKDESYDKGFRLRKHAVIPRNFQDKHGMRRLSVSDDNTRSMHTVMRERVRNRLEHHRKLLKANLDDIQPDLRYLKVADPDGALWDGFEDMVMEVLVSKQENDMESKASPRSLSAIEKAGSIDEWKGAVDRELRFAFLDYVVSDGKSKHSSIHSFVDLKYPTEWYMNARAMQRDIHLHVGPTNSGKTYTALKRLEEAKNGFYAGPLRLLAHEVFSRFNNRGINCDLVTGDDVRLKEEERVELYASTVEMVDISRQQEVGVVDEIQMIGAEDRGWAWTRALLGARVRELHLCGETRVVPLIREVVASMGDTLHIHQYDRLNPLKVMSKSLRGDLKKLQKGDCVVSFSIVGIHALKQQIEIETGKRVAIVYGSLPPETRAQQAALFNDPDNDYDYLVASDAIGMGLNLSIKRVIFETTMKWNGRFQERLSISQLKQIAGRAGRYKTAQDDKAEKSGQKSKAPTSIGLVTCLDEADLPSIQHAMVTDAPPLRHAGLLPPGEEFEDFAARLPPGTPFEYIMKRVIGASAINPRFKLCTTEDQLAIARCLDAIPNLELRDRLTFCASPATLRGRANNRQDDVVLAMGRAIAKDTPITVVDLAEIPLEILDLTPSSDRSYLESLEFLHKSLILYLWLSYRFQHIFRDQDMAVHAKQLCEEKINEALLAYSANPKLRQRLLQIKKTSTLLNEQLGEKVVDMPMTMNPDASIEEMERKMMEEDKKQNVEEEVEEATAAPTAATENAHAFDWASGAKEQNMQPVEVDVVDQEVQKEAAGSRG